MSANPRPHVHRYTAFVGKIHPRAGQGLGISGVSIPQYISNAIIETAKTGDIDKFTQEYMKYGVEVRDVMTDLPKFKQNLIFAAI
jgi:hypothetical protein